MLDRPSTALASAMADQTQSLIPRPRSSLPPVVVVTDARHAFGSRVALDGVSLTIQPGEIFGLLGPNGAGKSTLMRAICGRVKLDGGRVLLDGKDPRTDRVARRGIGFVPQDIALYANLTVRENLQAFARLSGVTRRNVAAAVTFGLERMGLADHANHLCRTLSGGYQRRLNICASILHTPKLLVLDEPTVGIDIDARESIHALLQDLRNQGTAILLTTHDLDQAQVLSDRVGILISGRFVAEGAPKDVLRQLFEGRIEVVAELASTPVDSARAAMQAIGLSAHSLHSWVGYFQPDDLDLPSVTRGLTAAGVPLKEMRIRQPGLTSLIVALIQADSDKGTPSRSDKGAVQ